MQALPERERKVMFLHYRRDMTFKEIGCEMGVSESRVCRLHRQALEMLRRRLNAH
ncbi:sigma-70 family RNA polymerase sigma factor [Hydrogenophaga intermedia]|nr:sigma-70 family RNA polymerase sigma factor [Hydrogenophaga intermedia]